MKIDWYGHYTKRMNDHYRNYMAEKYRQYFEVIVNKLPHTSKIAEFGCGTANVSRILQERYNHKKYHYILVDIDINMLQLASQNMSNCYGTSFELWQHDIRIDIMDRDKMWNTEDIGMIYSHGVLEHFSDKDISKIITAQLKITKNLVHYVPSDKYVMPSMGNERLMSSKTWWTKFKEMHLDKNELETIMLKDIVEFNDGYDLALIWS
jgi:SAM-dependent methyltransferase